MVRAVFTLWMIMVSLHVHAGLVVSFKQGSVKVITANGETHYALNGDIIRQGSRIVYYSEKMIHLRYKDRFIVYMHGSGDITVIDYNDQYSRFYLNKGEVIVNVNESHTVTLDSNGLTMKTVE